MRWQRRLVAQLGCRGIYAAAAAAAGGNDDDDDDNEDDIVATKKYEGTSMMEKALAMLS